MPRFKIALQYDGAKYFGWQFQPSKRTVQNELEKVITRFSNDNKITVHGSGRTDTGVHALNQVAHFDLATELDTCTLTKAINSYLPEDIFITSLEVVPGEFHARYSASKRIYLYQCYTGDNLLFRNQCWMTGPVDYNKLQSVAEVLIGEHDFLSFCKFRSDVKNTVCKIFESVWVKQDYMLNYNITGSRFLHHMIRYLTGTMIEISKGRYSLEDFVSLLKNPKKNVQIFKAPPQGLILKKIEYGKN